MELQPQQQTEHSSKKPAQRKKRNILQDKRALNPLQKKENNTGLPDNLKQGMENLSGMSLDHVKVHYNSPKPAAVQAHAYAQGGDIHLASGQEKHLPHELGHVVQQMQGRVKPTTSLGGVSINDNPALESEATLMGDRAIQRAVITQTVQAHMQSGPAPSEALHRDKTAQFHAMDSLGMEGIDYAVMSRKSYGSWQKTVQAKRMTGVCHSGDQVIVTQFRDPKAVQQQLSLPKLGAKAKGGLIIAEGVLTLAAGIAALTVSSGIALVPGISSVVVGISKIVRGSLSVYNGYQADKAENALAPAAQARIKAANAKRTKVMDALRGLEAAAAIVGSSAVLNPAGLVFGVAKAIRSVLMALANYLDKEKHPKAISAMKKIAAAAHVVEVLSGGVSGGLGISKGVQAGAAITTAGGVATGAVAVSKGVRAADQIRDAKSSA